jgi:hypothetical protein
MQEKAFGDSAKDDLIAKYFQIIKFELEAVLKLEDWNAMDDLFQVMLSPLVDNLLLIITYRSAGSTRTHITMRRWRILSLSFILAC